MERICGWQLLLAAQTADPRGARGEAPNEEYDKHIRPTMFMPTMLTGTLRQYHHFGGLSG